MWFLFYLSSALFHYHLVVTAPAHAFIAFIAANEYLFTGSLDVTFTVKSGIYGCLCPAPADRLDLGNAVSEFKQTLRAREQMRQEVRSQAKAQYGYVVF